MSYSCGIVGLPNAGKSTLFNAISRSSVPAADFPFCTIDPNRGRIQVDDPRLRTLTELVKPAKTVPIYLPIVDIAGLVKNASKGEGLGNRFLAHIRETDILLHTVACFDASQDDSAPNPIQDIEIIDTELILADIETVQRVLDKLTRNRKSLAAADDRTGTELQSHLRALLDHLGQGQPARQLSIDDDRSWLDELNLLTAKPVMYICNVGESTTLQSDPYVDQVRAWLVEQSPKDPPPVCVVCARLEVEISELSIVDQRAFITELGWGESGLQRIVHQANQLLGRLCFFTAGSQEVRAWSVAAGADARTCAGHIHSDFARGFIAAEVVAYDDFIHCAGWKSAREQGKVRLEGANYSVVEGDIMHFRFNV